MATYAWELQGTSDTVIAASDRVQFAGGTFNAPVLVNSYQDSTHVETSGGTDKSASNGPVNCKYVSSSNVDIGGGSVALNTLTDSDATLHINFSDPASITVFDHIFYAYDGTSVGNPPVGVVFQAAEVGDSSWTAASGQGSALQVADQMTPSTSHDFYIAASASPTSVGLKTQFTLRDELTYT